MLDFEVQRCTRRCAASGRELRPGERCVSVLIAEGAQVVRYDYAADAWQGPPDNCVGWWSARVPDGASQRVAWAPNDVMLDYFERLEGEEERRDVRYVLTLLLIRRRLLRLESTSTEPDGQEVAVVFCARNEREYRVVAMLPDEQRVREIQKELAALLFGGPPQATPTAPSPSPTTLSASTPVTAAVNATIAEVDHVLAATEALAADLPIPELASPASPLAETLVAAALPAPQSTDLEPADPQTADASTADPSTKAAPKNPGRKRKRAAA